jgi:hypothetical protein
MGTPFAGVPVIRLQRVGMLTLGYCWKVLTPDYEGPAGFVWQFPPHQYHTDDNQLLGGTGKHLSDSLEMLKQIGPWMMLERYVPRTHQAAIERAKRNPRRKR